MSGTLIQLLAALILCVLLYACGDAPANLPQTVAAIAARLEADDLAAADRMIRAGIRQWPEDPQLRELQGDLDLKRGYGTRAQAAYERALIRAPASRLLKVKLARALMAQDRFREALGVAQPESGDAPEINAQFRLVSLEAGVALDATNFRAWREEAEALWRLAGSPPPGSDMRMLRRGLEQAAAKWEPVEAGRQHARCSQPPALNRDTGSDIATGELIRVGPAEQVKTPAAAALAAQDGAVIEIAGGSYDGDTVTWTQNDLTLRGRNGRPRLRLGETGSGGSAIWVLRGARTVVENVEFAGAAGGRRDGTAIRVEGGDLTVRGSVFRGNDSAIVVAAGAVFTLEFNDLDAAPVVSRARVARINYNRIAGTGGSTRRLIDLPEGGIAEVLGNELESAGDAGPFAFIAFGAAGAGSGGGHALFVLNNTFNNRIPGSTGVRVGMDAPALVANNLYAGAPMSGFTGKAREGGNQSIGGSVAGARAASFELARDSPAIDVAIDPRTLDAAAPPVQFEYRHPGAGIARTTVWKPDAGAHEFCGSRFTPPSEPDLTLPEG